MDTSHQALLEFNLLQARWMDDILQQRWLKGGDKCSRIVFSTFKKRSAETEFLELLDSDRRCITLKEWEDIVDEVILHFTEAFRTRHEDDRSAQFDYIVREQDARIPPEACERLELPTQDDLKRAAMSLNKLRSPGPDGIPIEFYLALWDSVGHLLHALLLEGIREGHFSPVFVHGVIVLLPKADDFRLLNNKRPITLLNAMFKICSKHYKLLLAEVYVEFISPFQSAFIPGRTIYLALLLTTEVFTRPSRRWQTSSS